MSGLAILAVDDEAPALDEITYLLEQCQPVEHIAAVRTATEALRELHARRFDLVLLDVRMPGLDGLALATSLTHYLDPPEIVFVTAYQEHALEAFDIGAAGYLLKPVDRERLLQVLERIVAKRSIVLENEDPLDVVPVERGGRTLLVARSEISWLDSAGDYVRLHTREGPAFLVRFPLSTFEERWSTHGFARIHRSYLVALRDIEEIRTEGTHTTVFIAGHELPVSRRHLRELRERLVRFSRRANQ